MRHPSIDRTCTTVTSVQPLSCYTLWLLGDKEGADSQHDALCSVVYQSQTLQPLPEIRPKPAEGSSPLDTALGYHLLPPHLLLSGDSFSIYN